MSGNLFYGRSPDSDHALVPGAVLDTLSGFVITDGFYGFTFALQGFFHTTM